MREIVAGGSLGRLRMINTWHFNDWIYRPRAPWELEAGQGGNLVFNRGSHQVDIVRLIGGGLVRSVRAMTGVWDPPQDRRRLHGLSGVRGRDRRDAGL
jgi:phthalate 4,5-cis-dihydrodiol dehydrogenase